MATPRQIRGRIRVAKNIQQITKAMKMVAAARLRRAQEAVAAARPYSDKMREVHAEHWKAASERASSIKHPLLRPDGGRTPESIGIILDHRATVGLCGAYNSSVIRRANDSGFETVRPLGTERVKLVCIGKKGATFFRRRGYDDRQPSILSRRPGCQLRRGAGARADGAGNCSSRDRSTRCYLVYTQFFSRR